MTDKYESSHYPVGLTTYYFYDSINKEDHYIDLTRDQLREFMDGLPDGWSLKGRKSTNLGKSTFNIYKNADTDFKSRLKEIKKFHGDKSTIKV